MIISQGIRYTPTGAIITVYNQDPPNPPLYVDATGAPWVGDPLTLSNCPPPGPGLGAVLRRVDCAGTVRTSATLTAGVPVDIPDPYVTIDPALFDSAPAGFIATVADGIPAVPQIIESPNLAWTNTSSCPTSASIEILMQSAGIVCSNLTASPVLIFGLNRRWTPEISTDNGVTWFAMGTIAEISGNLMTKEASWTQSSNTGGGSLSFMASVLSGATVQIKARWRFTTSDFAGSAIPGTTWYCGIPSVSIKALKVVS